MAQEPAYVCPIMGNPVTAESPAIEHKGVRYRFCCDGCDDQFAADPETARDAASGKGWLIGQSLFNPVSKKRMSFAEAAVLDDHRGVRYPFATEAERELFRNAPALYAYAPEREVLYCPVMKNEVAGYGAASGYADYQGIRYYFCCAGCEEPFLEDPDSYIADVADKVRMVGQDGLAPAPKKTLMPTCAGCAGEARMLLNGELGSLWTMSYRFLAIDDVKARNRLTLDYRVNPRVSVGLETSFADEASNSVPDFGDDPAGYLRLSDGDTPVLPRGTWFITPERGKLPSVVFGFTSDRLSTPRGQAFFLTFAKSIPEQRLSPFVSVKVNSFDGKTVFPFGLNYMVQDDLVFQGINDGDYTHLLLTKLGERASYSLILPRTQHLGFSVNYAF